MPKPKRLLIENACYHVASRGNHKQKIFLKNKDYRKYLDILLHYKNKFRFKCYCWCLMPNHIHLVIFPKHKYDLIKIMQGSKLTYTVWFNSNYDKVGHLWQGRYKNYIIEKDEYFLKCLQYIESNPVRAKLSENPLEWPWSSHKYRTLGMRNKLLDEFSL